MRLNSYDLFTYDKFTCDVCWRTVVGFGVAPGLCTKGLFSKALHRHEPKKVVRTVLIAVSGADAYSTQILRAVTHSYAPGLIYMCQI